MKSLVSNSWDFDVTLTLGVDFTEGEGQKIILFN